MDIKEILQQRGIEYVTTGSNVKQGNINIHCPWCGDADPSQHLGIDLKTGRYACWRNIQHRGRTLHGLLMKLLGCSYEAVQALLTDTSDLKQVVERLKHKDEYVEESLETIGNERGLVKLSTHKRMHQRFLDYLMSRKYDYQHFDNLIDRYDLRCALTGRFKNRIVFPITVDEQLIGCTGRCVDGGKLRYLTHPGVSVKRNILWYDMLKKGGKRLWLCEGPFDAMRIDYISSYIGAEDRATCLFGVNTTPAQIEQILELSGVFEDIGILLDPDAFSSALRLKQILVGCKTTIKTISNGVKDPANLNWSQVRFLVERRTARLTAV